MKNGKRMIAMLLALVMILSTVLAVPTFDVTGYASTKKSVTVSTQKQMEAAMKNSGVTKITIQTTKKKSFSIPAKSYKNKTLVVNAPKASVTNAAKWESVTVKDAKSYQEKAKKNNIKVTDSKLTLEVAKGASVSELSLAKKEASIKLVADGKVTEVKVLNKATISISGKTKKTIAMTVVAKALDSKIETAVPVKVVANADVTLVVRPGAEKTTVVEKKISVNVTIENKSTEAVTVTDSHGKETVVAPVKEPDSKEDEKPEEDKKDEDKKEEDKKEEDKKDEDKKEDDKKPVSPSVPNTPSTPSSPSSPSIPSGPSTPIGPSTPVETAATRLQAAIEAAEAGETVTLTENVLNDVAVTWEKSGALTIDFKAYQVKGNFSITAPEATTLILKDSGAGEAGAKITGNLTIHAPKAHVENSVQVEGNVDVKGVANDTYIVLDVVKGCVIMLGQGKVTISSAIETAPVIQIDTAETVILAGDIDKVKIVEENAQVKVADNTTITQVEVKANSGSGEAKVQITTDSGNAKIGEVKADAPVEVGVPTGKVEATAPVEITAPVQELTTTKPAEIKANVAVVVVSSDEAVITVASDKTVSTVQASEGVQQVALAGNGTVSTIDVTKADTSVQVSVDAEGQGPSLTVTNVIASEEQKGNLDETVKDKVKTVDHIKVTPPTKTEYVKGQALDLTGAKVTVYYGSDENSADHTEISLTDSMIQNVEETGKVTVTYAGKTDEFTVTYKEDSVQSVILASAPAKTVYSVGDAFDPTNLCVNVVFESGKKTLVSYTEADKAQWSITFADGYADGKFTKGGSLTASVTYGGKDVTESFGVEVLKLENAVKRFAIKKGGYSTVEIVENGDHYKISSYELTLEQFKNLENNLEYELLVEETGARIFYEKFNNFEESGEGVPSTPGMYVIFVETKETDVYAPTSPYDKSNAYEGENLDFFWIRVLKEENSITEFKVKEDICAKFETRYGDEGDSIDVYYLKAENFSDLKDNVVATAMNKGEVKFRYGELYQADETFQWNEGLPTTPGDYLVRAYVEETDTHEGAYAHLWVMLYKEENEITSFGMKKDTYTDVNTRVNGDNKSFTCYTIADEMFQQLGDALDYTSTHECEVEFEHKDLQSDGEAYISGLPSSKGGYVIRIRTKETDAYYASEWACIWVVG